MYKYLQKKNKTRGDIMINKDPTPCPSLFKAQDKISNQEVYFDTPQEAYEWMIYHQHWVLKRREVINWTFPLEQIVSQECWIEIGK